MTDIRNDFLIDPEVTFLNHGSFGACPRPVFEDYQKWQYELERQPLEFLGRRSVDLLAEARTALASFLNIEPDEVVYFPNPTTAINMVARNLNLQPGDEIIATNHEYGAMDRTWNFICEKTGAQYIQQPIDLPVTDHQAFADTFLDGLTSNTRVIFISHITSPTALIFPVKEICDKARQLGIMSIVDGAHAVGHLDLDLSEIDADIYTGACHKWLCAPKGASFLYADQRIQSILEPLVVSWGYQSEKPGPSQFIDYHEWQGTRDLAAFLSVPTAIKYQQENNWPEIQKHCHNLAKQGREIINSITGLEPISPASTTWFNQMASVRMPDDLDHEALQAHLYDQYRIEIPVISWQNENFLRISVQAYNQVADIDKLVEAISESLDLFTKREVTNESH